MSRPLRSSLITGLLCMAVTLASHEARAAQGSDAAAAEDSARIAPRMLIDAAEFAIVTTDGTVALLVAEDALSLQLTDEGLKDLEDRIGEDAESGSLAARVLGGMLQGGVRALLDHRIDYPLARLTGAEYEAGRLRITTIDGDSYLEDTEYDGRPILESFPAREARRFAERLTARVGSRGGR